MAAAQVVYKNEKKSAGALSIIYELVYNILFVIIIEV